MDNTDARYLELLSRMFPTKSAASAEIINLSAILSLPKGTEFFCSDIHGEYEAFSHVMRNASGSIRLKIEEVFGSELTDAQKSQLATLIYYPERKMTLLKEGLDAKEQRAFFETTLLRLIKMTKRTSLKYTRSRVRKCMPSEFAYIIDELIAESGGRDDGDAYYHGIIKTIIDTNEAESLICALARLIQRLSIERLHIIGDIFDRGPMPHVIMDSLIKYHSVDIQWGNHDIVWMGAALGQWGCIAHVVRNCARYGNLSILEDAYGINILPLAEFSRRTYEDDPCQGFALKGSPDINEREHKMCMRIQKAMAMIQFKVEGQLIDEYPSFGLSDRKLLDKVDFKKGTVDLDGTEYELTDKLFLTVDPGDIYRLTPEEENVMRKLEAAFLGCEKLQRHMRFLLSAGSLYRIENNNLMFHACVPLNDDGTLKAANIFGEELAGRALYDRLDEWVRIAFNSNDPDLRKKGRDLIWYMWLGPASPLFAKSKMATFELYLIEEKEARKEVKNAFYKLVDDKEAMTHIFEDFGLDFDESRIICGHVPVKVKDGEDPIHCDGHVLMIDGGFSKAYQPTTGIAGYTLISNSHGFILAAHEPLDSTEAAIHNEADIFSTRRIVGTSTKRKLIADTDKGKELRLQIEDLKQLLSAYESGLLAEKVTEKR